MKLRDYPETDSLYIELKPGPSVETREVAGGLNVDSTPMERLWASTSTMLPSASTFPRWRRKRCPCAPARSADWWPKMSSLGSPALRFTSRLVETARSGPDPRKLNENHPDWFEGRSLHGLLLVTGQFGEAVDEGVGDAEVR